MLFSQQQRRLRFRRRGLAVLAVVVVFALAGAACGSGDDGGDAPEATNGAPLAEESTALGADESVVADETVLADEPVVVVVEEVAFFDESFVHEVSVTFDLDEYLAMIAVFSAIGEKEWIKATVTLDGFTYEQVGMRLKGNSSLSGLAPVEEGRPVAIPGRDASADKPEDLPWLIRLDKFVDGQNYEGLYDLVIRSNTSQTSLNEAVAVDLLDAAGLASQDAVAIRFRVNGGPVSLRLGMENPDDGWMVRAFGPGGGLYKARSDGNWDYRGGDFDAYDESFDQKAGKGDVDLTPLVDFLDFINNADDATFDAGLPERLDIDGFAVYLAMQDLLQNFDDINGPGNNAYVHYDPTTGQFTVVPWDNNFSLAGLGFLVEGGPVAEAAGVPDFGPNVLVDRFLANPDFEELYLDQIEELTRSLYDSGLAGEILARRVEVLDREAGDLVDQDTLTAEADRIAAHFATAS